MSTFHEIPPKPEADTRGFEADYPALLEDVSVVGEEALHAVAYERGFSFEDAHFQEACGPVTDIMIPELTKLGYNIPSKRGERHMTFVGWKYDEHGTSLPINEQPEKSAVVHRFPVIDFDGTPEHEVIADATWQQFLTPQQRTPDLPKVLAGTREDVQAFLEGKGLDGKDLVSIWQKTFVPNNRRIHLL